MAGIAAIFSGCDTRIEERPIEIAESRAIQSIEEGGSDPADWKLEGECVAMGPCQVQASAAGLPDEVLAIDRYTVKDSRASLNGTDRIREAAQAATDRGCFDNITTAEKLRSCIAAP